MRGRGEKSRSSHDLITYHTLLTAFTSATTSAKTNFFQSKISVYVSNSHKLHQLLFPPHPSPSLPIPPHPPSLQMTSWPTLKGRWLVSGTPQLIRRCHLFPKHTHCCTDLLHNAGTRRQTPANHKLSCNYLSTWSHPISCPPSISGELLPHLCSY